MPEFVQPGMIRMKVITPSAHWDAPSHGAARFEHQVDENGNTYVVVPREAVRALAQAGYVVINE
jgi:hypothetical protein